MSILRKSGPFLNLLSWFGTLALPGRKLRTLKVSKNKFKIIFKTGMNVYRAASPSRLKYSNLPYKNSESPTEQVNLLFHVMLLLPVDNGNCAQQIVLLNLMP